MMRRTAFAVLAALMAAVPQQAPAGAAAQDAGKKSTLEGVYSEPQARRGQQVFDETCSRCHMKDLSGSGDAPSLAGNDFQLYWTDVSVWMLADRIQKNMPQDKPGTLTLAASVDVVAYVLSKNGYPSGAAELAPDRPALETIVITKK